MFAADDVRIEIEEVDANAVLITVSTPVGTGRMLGDVLLSGRTLYIDKVHIAGLAPGRLGRSGINAILRKRLAEADVDEIVIQGATRTTGRYVGRRPSPVVFPH